LQFGDRQTDKQTDRQTDEQMNTPVAWSRSRCRQWWLKISISHMMLPMYLCHSLTVQFVKL